MVLYFISLYIETSIISLKKCAISVETVMVVFLHFPGYLFNVRIFLIINQISFYKNKTIFFFLTLFHFWTNVLLECNSSNEYTQTLVVISDEIQKLNREYLIYRYILNSKMYKLKPELLAPFIFWDWIFTSALFCSTRRWDYGIFKHIGWGFILFFEGGDIL